MAKSTSAPASTSSVPAAETKKRVIKKRYTFVGMDEAGNVAGFYSTFRDVQNALSVGEIAKVQIWHGKSKVSA